jgi:hydroxymethylpyrimidine pyrophosphatase-like HAD family hydrolase
LSTVSGVASTAIGTKLSLSDLMRYHALACDYDGTIAEHGVVAPATRAALARLRASGRRVVLVTGRRLDDLERVCPDWSIFDAIVAENGAVYLRPPSREPRLLGPPPPNALLDQLRAAGVTPLVNGEVIVATSRPHEIAVMEAIRELGLELQVIFNKGAVMVLPSGINKASGLAAALADLGLSAHDVVGIGDAENDHAFLARCGLAVAVADALPSLKDEADIVTQGGGGAGAEEIVDALLRNDAARLTPRPGRRAILIGKRAEGGMLSIPARDGAILCAGMSGGGKSTVVTGFLERLGEHGYQYCVVDPEGDYGGIVVGPDEAAVGMGAAHRAPTVDEVTAALSAPHRNVVVNLLGLALEERPRFCAVLLPRLVEMRARFGRPHWIVIDEAHHVLPRDWQATTAAVPEEITGLVLVTVHPQHIAPTILAGVSLVLAVGRDPVETLRASAAALGVAPPDIDKVELPSGEALAWNPREGSAPARVRVIPPRVEHKRHVRKYAEGELGPDQSFYFRGPGGRLNLRAQNLRLFLQVADGVDDDTWLHHLRQRDYSRWIRTAMKDTDLADDVAAVENTADVTSGVSALDTRARIRAAVEARYTAAP